MTWQLYKAVKTKEQAERYLAQAKKEFRFTHHRIRKTDLYAGKHYVVEYHVESAGYKGILGSGLGVKKF